MSCQEARGLMTKAMYEPLSPEQDAVLRQHLAGCPDCRVEESGMRPLEQQLREMTGPAPAAQFGPVDRWRSVSRRRRALTPLAFAGAGGLALAALAGWLVFAHPKPTVQGRIHPTPSVPAPETPVTVASGPPHSAAPEHAAQKPKPNTAPAVMARGDTRAAPPSGFARVRHATQKRQPASVPAVADDRWLDGRDSRLAQQWLTGRDDAEARRWLEAHLPAMRDDFVQVKSPLLAAADPKSPAVRDAVKQYEKEAAVVDSRLFAKVTLQMKGASLEELCKELEEQTRVKLSASRGMRDEKVTIFVKDEPARDLMRAVARLLSCRWTRFGEEGAYRYEISQDLRQQLAEQEMRNRDLNEALLALDAKMQASAGLAGLTPDQIRARMSNAKGEELTLRQNACGVNWGGYQVYHRLTPAERAALGSGQQLRYSTNDSRPDRRLPDDWRQTLLGAWGDQAMAWSDQQKNNIIGPYEFLKSQGLEPKRFTEWPNAYAGVNLRIDRSELGTVSLNSESMITLPSNGQDPGLGANQVLATAQSPSVANPENGKANAGLKNQAPFTKTVSLKPEVSCPVLRMEKLDGKAEHPEDDDQPGVYMGHDLTSRLWRRKMHEPHVTTADMWEAVHEQTGLPIVADYYTHLYPQAKVTAQKTTLFEALNHVCDVMRIRWRKDGAFLLGRSSSFFWDKQKEVPNRLLDHWQMDKQQAGGLPMADLIEMALLTDAQLDSEFVGDGIAHCRGLREWRTLGSVMGGYSSRPFLRLIADLNAAKRDQALAPTGLPTSALTPAEQSAFLNVMGPRIQGDPEQISRFLTGTRIRVSYAPEGYFAWVPIAGPTRPQQEAWEAPLCAGRTREAALAALRRIEPKAAEAEIMRSEGILYVTVVRAGKPGWHIAGQRPIRYEAPNR
jgi:hypothetical protein